MRGVPNERSLLELQERMLAYPAMIVLMDPDVAGRQARNRLAEAFPRALHSFVPQLEATSLHPSRSACTAGCSHRPGLHHSLPVIPILTRLVVIRCSNPCRSHLLESIVWNTGHWAHLGFFLSIHAFADIDGNIPVAMESNSHNPAN